MKECEETKAKLVYFSLYPLCPFHITWKQMLDFRGQFLMLPILASEYFFIMLRSIFILRVNEAEFQGLSF